MLGPRLWKGTHILSLTLCSRNPWLHSAALSDYSFHPRRAHLSVMVTPRTHCHFMMQARALRVPEFCDNHTPPSCLVTNSLAKPRFRSVNTLVLPHPLLTQGGPVTFPVCALYQLFVRSCVFGASWPVLFTCLCLHTSQLDAASLFGVCLRHFQFSDGKTPECAAASWHH